MYRTFNCGIGMVLAVDAARVDAVRAALEAEGETVHEIGAIVPRAGGPAVVIDGIDDAGADDGAAGR